MDVQRTCGRAGEGCGDPRPWVTACGKLVRLEQVVLTTAALVPALVTGHRGQYRMAVWPGSGRRREERRRRRRRS